MPNTSKATTTSILEGRIDKLRVAVPLITGDVYLRVDGVPVNGSFEDPAMVRTLRGLHEQAMPVRIGVLTDSKGNTFFSWLIARKGPGVPPRYYVDERRKAWRYTGIGAALATVAIGIAWLLGLGSAWRAIGLALMLAVAPAGVCVAGLSLHGLWSNRRHRVAILESEAAFRAYTGKPISSPPEAALDSTPVSVRLADEAPPSDEDLPPIRRVLGTLTSLTHEARRSVRSGPSFGIYRFVLGKQPYVMTVGENLGDIKPFLAEGDEVEMAVLASDAPGGGPHQLVYAMRNLEDGRVYVCHHGFRGGNSQVSPIGVGLTQRAPMLKMLAGLFLFTWLVLIAIMFSADSPSDDGPVLVTYSLLGFFALWVCVALPFLYLDMRWRAGRPTRRQRILERIYAVMGLGTPFAPSERVEEV